MTRGDGVNLPVKFENFTGLYHYHCHDLEHEALRIMRNSRANPNGDGGDLQRGRPVRWRWQGMARASPSIGGGQRAEESHRLPLPC